MVRKLFITPPDAGTGLITRCVRVPASQEWLAVFNRALLTLTEEAQWEQLDEYSLTPEEAAALAYEAYVDWLSGECSLDCNDVTSCLGTFSQELVRAGTYNVNVVDPADTQVIETRFPTQERETGILPDPVTCDPDEVWAGVLEIVTRLDQNGADFWDTIIVHTDTIERIAEIIALVPILGDVIGEGLELLADVAPTMQNLYDAYSSQQQIEEIACDLFSLVCNDCRYPSYQEVFDYYAGRSALGETQWMNIALQALVDALLGTSTASPALCYMTTNILQIWVLSAAATFIKTYGVKYIATWARIGSAVPSDAWEVICGPCGGAWSHDFLGGDGQPPLLPIVCDFGNGCVATYDGAADVYRACEPGNTTGRWNAWGMNFGSSTTINRIDMTVSTKVTRSTGSDHASFEAPVGTELARFDYDGLYIGEYTLTWVGSVPADSIKILNLAGYNNSLDLGRADIIKLHIEGNGIDPFI